MFEKYDRQDSDNKKDEDDYKKVTLIDQISIAVTSPRNYKHLVKLKGGRLVLFLVVVSFLFAFMEFGIDAIFWTADVGGFKNLATNVIPEFVYEDGRLSMAEDYQIDVGGSTIYINTDSSSVDMSTLESDGTYIAIGSEKMVMGMVSGGQSYTYMTTPLKYLIPINGFDNDDLAGLAPLFYVYIVVIFVCIMVGKASRQLMIALLFSIVGNAFAKTIHTGLSYGKVLVICVYAQTVAMFVMSLNTALDNIVPELLVWLVTMIISMRYMNNALMSYANGDFPPGELF